MTRIRTKKFGPYKAELTIEEEEDNKPYVYCHVNFQHFSGSLATLTNIGELSDERGIHSHPVPQDIVDKIKSWAEDMGY